MSVSILLLRGINVGGRNTLPMAELKRILVACGAEAPQTYIQSGNAVCRGTPAPGAITEAIEAAHGFSPLAITCTLSEWRGFIDAMPFGPVEDAKALHLFVARDPLTVTRDDLAAEAGEDERLAVLDRAVWLHTPRYLTGSRIAPRLERLLGTPATARNWRTVLRLRDMAEALE